MGTLETPQDRHRYIHRTGPPEWNRQTEAKEEQGAQEAKAGGPSWPWPRPGLYSRDLCTPPKKWRKPQPAAGRVTVDGGLAFPVNQREPPTVGWLSPRTAA